MLNLYGDFEVKRVPIRRRPKGADVDQPEGYIKTHLRRVLRLALRGNLKRSTEGWQNW